ncbi:Fpg/Nei family DNA glycosylase [Agromyces archimandritae]|uniref:Fpg/Nei family DNA glycosylase n=1 Tax=Agromyces archimandritae TaxID=2781962 RepID=A0A975FM30_9MICO|nr:Fpg/Nei family DNA glycosylase [Agromyces archimandritae]QTX04232.1 Fpg/Nei family DNA glycosylase [Agromyces archimandritae]
MPEMPEVEALTRFLREHAGGRTIDRVSVAAISALKTVDPPPSALAGREATGVVRHGKFLDLDAGGIHLVFHLARAGWLRWYEQVPATPVRPGRSPIALRLRFTDGTGFDLTEAGTKKSLAVHIVRDPAEVPGIARLGPDPMAEGFTKDDFARILAGHRTRIKGLLRDQSVFAGIGNAYSDEILHTAQMSPFALAASLDDVAVERLFTAMRRVLGEAIVAADGKPPAELKDAKRTGMRVHGRTGRACPVCGDTIRKVTYADSEFQYCPTCQTGGKPLSDRVLSRLLK